jgi:hypothetical protein
MDEYSRGVDPEIKKYFRKIINSFSVGALWLVCIATLGIFFQLGFIANGIKWYNILFYFVFIISMLMLIRYYYRVWK